MCVNGQRQNELIAFDQPCYCLVPLFDNAMKVKEEEIDRFRQQTSLSLFASPHGSECFDERNVGKMKSLSLSVLN